MELLTFKLNSDPLVIRLELLLTDGKYSWLEDHFFMEARFEVETDMWRLGDGVCLGDGELLELARDGEGEGIGDAELELRPPSL